MRVKATERVLKELIETGASIPTDEAIVIPNDDNLLLLIQDPTNSMMAACKMDTDEDYIDHYETGEEPEIALQVGDLDEFLNKKDGDAELIVDHDRSNVLLKNSQDLRVRMNLIARENAHNPPDPSNFDYPIKFTIDKSVLNGVTSDSNKINADQTHVCAREEGVYFYSESATAEKDIDIDRLVKWDNLEDVKTDWGSVGDMSDENPWDVDPSEDKVANCILSTDRLKNMNLINDSYEIRLEHNLPIKFVSAESEIMISYMIAPRIPNPSSVTTYPFDE